MHPPIPWGTPSRICTKLKCSRKFSALQCWILVRVLPIASSTIYSVLMPMEWYLYFLTVSQFGPCCPCISVLVYATLKEIFFLSTTALLHLKFMTVSEFSMSVKLTDLATFWTDDRTFIAVRCFMSNQVYLGKRK